MTALFSLAVIIFAIYLLAIITDEFFIESLDEISTRWRLPPNVAGASLMAMGSSAPELAIAILALFQDGGAHSDLGIGTIVGSAVFNVLIITGVSAIVRPARLSLRVISRDVVMYLASIGLLFATFSDGTITLTEAIIFLALYAIYIVVLFQWDNFVPKKEMGEDPIDIVEEELRHSQEGQSLTSRFNHAVASAIGFLTGNARDAYLRAFTVSIASIVVTARSNNCASVALLTGCWMTANG